MKKILLLAAALMLTATNAEAKGIYFAGPRVCGNTYEEAKAKCDGAIVQPRWEFRRVKINVVPDNSNALGWNSEVDPWQMSAIITRDDPRYAWYWLKHYTFFTVFR